MALEDRPCTVCSGRFPRDEMIVKRVVFYEFGRNGKMIKSRTVAWLCPQHRDADPDWRAEAYQQQKQTTKELT